jgi:hypothetical protein
MNDKKDGRLPEIDTSHFECGFFSLSQSEQFLRDRPDFINLLHRLIIELQLEGQIERLKVKPDRCRAELYREPENPWPSKRLCLEIYPDRYMDERLLRHELGHEADRWNPKMLYDPAIEERWKLHWAFNLAANISLDARLCDGGLGRDLRLKDFRSMLGEDCESVFEEAWTNPPKTWPKIEALASKLSVLRPQD